jgi:N-acyl-D-amino-acid deacylase
MTGRASCPAATELVRERVRRSVCSQVRPRVMLGAALLVALTACTVGPEAGARSETPGTDSSGPADILLAGGHVLDGAGNPWVERDIAVTGDRIVFVGPAAVSGITARDTVDVTGLLVTPGLWDAHSHAELENENGKTALPYITQGITTVVLGVDGGGANNIAEIFEQYERTGIGVNALRFVGHEPARIAAMGVADRAPDAAELQAMKEYVDRGMREGAFGLSTGLFYSPGYFAETDEVIELNRVAARYGGIYDTHDRDLGAAYRGIGFVASMEEAIEIGEAAGTPVIFSHLNPQGAHNYGRADQAAALVDAARARGVNVMAAQHPYTASQARLAAYAVPRWVVEGGTDSLRARLNDAAVQGRLDVETTEMLEIRGGPSKIVVVGPEAELNGKTLARLSAEWNLSVPETVRRILLTTNPYVMNLDLYDIANTRFLAAREWMMTCTDGRTPAPGQDVVHPRVYGAMPRKIRLFVREEPVITMQFAIRGMTSLPATFFDVSARGEIRQGWYADIAIFDEGAITDMATFEEPHQYSRGVVHLLVNGQFAIRDGEVTGVLAGRPIRRGD